MKYTLIILTICLMIFAPKRDVSVQIVEANTGSKGQIITSPDIENRVILTPTPTKTMYVPTSEIEKLICDVFGDDCEIAIAVAKAESGLRCDAHGDRHLSPSSYGVFQIRAFEGRPPIEELTNCEANIRYAKFMYDRQGWGPWSAYTNGSYLGFIN